MDQLNGFPVPTICCAQPPVLWSGNEVRHREGSRNCSPCALWQSAMQIVGLFVISVHLLCVSPRQVLVLRKAPDFASGIHLYLYP